MTRKSFNELIDKMMNLCKTGHDTNLQKAWQIVLLLVAVQEACLRKYGTGHLRKWHLQDRSIIDDALQETVLRLTVGGAAARFDERKGPWKGYVFVVFRNAFRELLRQQQRFHTIADMPDGIDERTMSPPDTAHRNDCISGLQMLLRRLTPRQRDAFEARWPDLVPWLRGHKRPDENDVNYHRAIKRLQQFVRRLGLSL